MTRFFVVVIGILGLFAIASLGLATENARNNSVAEMHLPAIQLNLHSLVDGKDGDVVGDVIHQYQCPDPGKTLIESTNGSKWVYFLATDALLEMCVLTGKIDSPGCRLITQIARSQAKCIEDYAVKSSRRDNVKVTEVKGNPPLTLENLPNKVQEFWKWVLGK